MLKVVGASSLQTKISWCILQGMILFGGFTFFYGMLPRNEDDGKYAATVFWNRETGKFDIQFWGQNNEPNSVRRGAARAYYQPDMSKTGWATLEIETNELYPDRVQAFSAGMLEGSLSWLHIYWHWKNTVQSTCLNKEEFCDYVREFLLNNTEAVRTKAKQLDKTDSFWHQINLFYTQLDGLEYGWKLEVGRNRKDYEIPHLDFLWMNIMPDIKDFEKKFNASRSPVQDYRASSSVALLKLIPQQKRNNFLLAHASSGLYSSMLRTRKKYNFGYHRSGKINSQLVSGRNIRFSSYPAAIHSQDDFYQIKLVNEETITVAGSILHNYNPHSWHSVDSRKHVLLGLRVMASNRLSQDGNSWSRLMSKFNSGTGNKQWLHLHSRKTKNVTLWVTEQMPGEIVSNDETETLINHGHWISYGIPHYRKIQDVSAHNEKTDKSKYHAVLYNLSVRRVLQHGQRNVTDIDSLLHLMRGSDLTLAGRTDLHDQDIPIMPYSSTSVDHLASKESSEEEEQEVDNDGRSEENQLNSNADVDDNMAAIENSLQYKLNNNNNNNNNNNDGSDFPDVSIKRGADKNINNRKYINLEYDALNTFYLEYNTTVKKFFTLRNFMLLYNPKAILNKSPLAEVVVDRRKTSKSLLLAAAAETTFANKRTERFDIDGVIDLKITNNNEEFVAAAGPPFTVKNNEPISIAPFQWSKSRINYLPHNGHTDVWNYLPVVSDWKWN